MSASSAAASASQADRLRDLQSSQPPISATTTTASRVQPRAPSPPDSAAAGVPAASDVGAEVGVRVAGEVAGVVVGELGRSAEVGVSTLVWGDRVGSTVVSLGESVSLGDSVPLGAGRVPERSVEGRDAEPPPPPAPQPLSARTRLSTTAARSHAVAVRHPGMPGSTRRSLVADTNRRDSIQDVRIEVHLRIGRARRGKPARHATRSFFGPRTLSASPEADENGVGPAVRTPGSPGTDEE
jgi:hypothetical protein